MVGEHKYIYTSGYLYRHAVTYTALLTQLMPVRVDGTPDLALVTLLAFIWGHEVQGVL